MSEGFFLEDVVYTADDGKNFPCRCQPETTFADLDPASPGITLNVPATLTPDDGLPTINLKQGKRSNGVWGRRISVRFGSTVGVDLPDGYDAKSEQTIIIFDPAKFASISKNQDISYLGVTAKVRRKYREQIR